MRFFILRSFLIVLCAGSTFFSVAQVQTNQRLLNSSSAIQAQKETILRQKLQTLAIQKGWDLVRKEKEGRISILVGIDSIGMPLYLSTDNNIIAAATIGTNKLWPGGQAGLSLNGSSAAVKSKLAIWDGGKVRNTHTELTGRVTQKDGASSNSDHATHVAGTMIASGVNANAKGMSFGQQELLAYDFGNDLSEMFGAASGLLVSNHSYGFNAGWNFNENANRWEFLGQFDAVEDYKFGYYSNQAQEWDSIAYNAPYYLMVKSAGNNRSVNGPAVGQPYWRYNESNVMSSAGNRPAGISSNDGYDIISLNGVAKNILTVGAINPISSGYSTSADVVMSSFSSWGPTDDGRIKPDVVADGVNLLSSVASSNTAYASLSGTSMATPNVSGSLLLLQEYYGQLHSGNFMRAATLKGLVIHTANEAGTAPGPDYRFGWGLVNMEAAASVITSNNTTQLIQENVMNNGGSLSIPVIASGNGSIKATISWTDPKGTVTPFASALDNPTKKLVNDLDIVIKKGAAIYQPWILNPASPSSNASTGDNNTDNVEKVEFAGAIPGETYTIEITHKGTLERGSQAYSLLVSGVGGQAYCASNPTANTGARIDSVSIGENIRQKNAAGCTSYSSFTNISGNIQPGESVPFLIRMNSCDASAADKIVKIYIDGNNDGDFTDLDELVATSAVINGNGDFTGSFQVPAALTPGKLTILRIVMQETRNAAGITPCGTYSKGETQDYKFLITSPANDAGVIEVVNPVTGNCASGTQLMTVRIKNFGSTAQSNIPVSATVKQGSTTIRSMSEVFPGTIAPGADVVYTFQDPFVVNENGIYTITSSTGLAGDQSASNDQLVTAITINPNSTTPTGATALICGTSAQLNANSSSGDVYSWYTSNSAASAIAIGATTSTTTIATTYYVGKNDANLRIGPADKNVFPSGGYNRFSGNFIEFTNNVPLTIESAKLYIGNGSASGKLTLTVGRNFTFNSTNGSYTYIPEASTTLDIFATDPTPQAGAQPNDPTDEGATFYFNLPVTTTGEHILILSQAASDNATFFRNNAITTSPYPIGIPGIFSITDNSASYSNPPGDFQAFYYFFYDMKLRLQGCPSPRAPVVATNSVTPVILLTGNQLSVTSTINPGTTFQWYRDNSPISGATTNTHAATDAGDYKLVTTEGNCALTSNIVTFSVTPVVTVDPAEIGLTLAPNPAPAGQFNIRLETLTRADLGITLLNGVGQKVYGFTIPSFIGRLSRTITPGKLAPGIYYLQVIHDKKRYIRQVVITE